MKTQKWWESKVALTTILAQVVLVIGLYCSSNTVNAVQVIGAAAIVIIGVITAANNPTNPNGWGAQ